MATFSDLPLEVRLIIYRMILPPEILISQGLRYDGPFCEGIVKYDPSVAARIIHVSRQIRQEALSLISSRIRYMIRLYSPTYGSKVNRTFDWLLRFGPPNTDALRKVTISCYQSPNRLSYLLKDMAELPRVSLRFDTLLWMLKFADKNKYMSFHCMHGFTHASFVNWNDGFKFCDRHKQRSRKERRQWEDLHERFQQAVTKLTSPCPGKWCRIHPERPPHHPTSSLEIGWYVDGPCSDINCVSGILADERTPWTPGPGSIFTRGESPWY